MRTRWRGSRRVASMPSMPGMRMSISTTSGACASAAATASSPVPASATTSIDAGRLEHRLEAGAHHRLVVGDDDAQPAHAARRRRAATARTSKPRPSRGPAVSVPPNSAARSRMPTRPWPPGLGGGGALAGVGDRQLERVGAVAERDRGVRAAGVLDDVRQRLLHDPVGGQVDALRQRPRLALDGQLDADAGGAGALEQLVELAEPRLRRELGRVVLAAAQQLQRAVHLGHRLAAEVGDPVGRLGTRSSPAVAPSACACTTIS